MDKTPLEIRVLSDRELKGRIETITLLFWI